ncbi:MAG: ABC transporter permease [Bacteroidales bacterium]|nr:ABC transporter permease [Bacteroidales bacterium]
MPRGGQGFSGPLSTIAVTGIALGVIVMVMAVSILRGFQADIREKVSGFGGHLTVTSFTMDYTYSESPLVIDSSLRAAIGNVAGVRHVQPYATKGGMVKTEDQIYGIMFRGVDNGYDTCFFASCLTEGRMPNLGDTNTSNEVIVSSTIASKLGLAVGDKMRTYFWQHEGYRSRAFTVCGIYSTDLSEMDEIYVVGDLRQVQRLNDWMGEEFGGEVPVGGYEILVDNFDRLDATAAEVLSVLPYDMKLTSIKEAHPSLFAWLDLLNTNIALILTIMCLVSAVAIVSALLIMIFEKSSTIGLLKALGAMSVSVRRTFLLKTSTLILKGILIGDAIALLLSYAQYHWQIIRLDPESYSMTHVPVEINPSTYLLISVGTLVVCFAALLLPATYISKISPARTMRIER